MNKYRSIASSSWSSEKLEESIFACNQHYQKPYFPHMFNISKCVQIILKNNNNKAFKKFYCITPKQYVDAALRNKTASLLFQQHIWMCTQSILIKVPGRQQMITKESGFGNVSSNNVDISAEGETGFVFQVLIIIRGLSGKLETLIQSKEF